MLTQTDGNTFNFRAEMIAVTLSYKGQFEINLFTELQ